MNRLLRFAIASLVTMSLLLVSCGGAVQPAAPAGDDAAAAPTAAATAEEPTKAAEVAPATAAPAGPVKMKIFAPQLDYCCEDLPTNLFSLEAQKMFNIEFEWQLTTMDGNSAKELRQISLASGDYPDVYMLIPWIDQFSQLDLLKYGKEGVILPLNDLIQEHAPNIQRAMQDWPEFKPMITAPDGNIYGLVQWVECYHCTFGNKMWVNSKWLKALKLEVPKTTDEFQAMLEAFKTQDPNGNGVADEVPLSGSIEDYGTRVIPYLMNGFIYDDDRTYLILSDGKVDIAANKQEWKDGLTYIKGLFDAGLIDPGAFTQNVEAFMKIGNNADAQLLGTGAAMHPATFVTTGPEAPYGADYDVIPPLQGPHANFSTYLHSVVPGATFVLTNNASAEAQVAAIKLVDYMFSLEGQLRSNQGVEGVDWRRPQAGDVALNKDADPLFANIEQPEGSEPRNSHWGAGAQYNNSLEFYDRWVQSTDPDEYYNWPGYERRLFEATNLYQGKESPNLFPFWTMWPDPATADTVAMTKQNITDYVNQNALAFVTGSKDLKGDWDAYVAGFEQLDLAGYLASQQKSCELSLAK